MTKRGLGFLFGGLALVALLFYWFIIRPLSQLADVLDFGTTTSEPFADLPRVPLLATLGEALPEYIVYQDSNDGWFLIQNMASLSAVDIGMYQNRLFDQLAGQHIPAYCSGGVRDGRIVWGVQNNQIIGEIAFCNPRRLDLGDITALGEPVTMHDAWVSADQSQSIIADVANDPTHFGVKYPVSFDTYDMQKIIRLPHIWQARDSDTPIYHVGWSEQIAAIIARDLPDIGSDYDLRFELGYATDYGPSIQLADGSYTLGDTASGVQIDGKGYVFTPGFAIYRPTVTFKCDAEVCAQLAKLDLAILSDPYRDFDVLDTASAAPRALQVVNDQMPDMDDVRAGIYDNAAATPILYQLRYVTTGRIAFDQ